MSEPKKTYQDLVTFANVAQAWLAKDKANHNTKLAFAIQRTLPRIQKLTGKEQRTFEKKMRAAKIEACAVNDQGHLLTDAQGYVLDRKKALELNETEADLIEKLLETEITIKADITTAPKGLTAAEYLAFKDIVLEGEPAEPEEKAEAQSV